MATQHEPPQLWRKLHRCTRSIAARLEADISCGQNHRLCTTYWNVSRGQGQGEYRRIHDCISSATARYKSLLHKCISRSERPGRSPRAYSSYSPPLTIVSSLRVRKSYYFPPPPSLSSPLARTQATRKLPCNSTIHGDCRVDSTFSEWNSVEELASYKRTKSSLFHARRFSWLLLSTLVNHGRYNGTLRRVRVWMRTYMRARARARIW